MGSKQPESGSGSQPLKLRVAWAIEWLLRAIRSEAQFIRQHTAPGVPVVVLLTLLTVVLHGLHWLEVTEGLAMRHVYRGHLAGSGQAAMLEVSEASQRIHIIEASASMRARELDTRGDRLDSTQVDRVGGVRPIDREKMAGLILRLASRLKGLPEGERPKVVAIDVDLAPLLAGDGPPMAWALDRLREVSTVISIVMDRADADQRLARNQFMVETARCTGGGVLPAGDGNAGAKPLYFASPRVFQPINAGSDYPLKFPYGTARYGPSLHPLQPASGHFPSLSNLVALALQAGTGPAPEALTLLCRQAAQKPTNGMLLEDLIAGHRTAQDCKDDAKDPNCRLFDREGYQELPINWTLQDGDHIRRTQIDDSDRLALQVERAEVLHADLLRAGTLILAIDGGAGHDKFEAAAPTHEPIGGATLLALQALSVREDKALLDHSLAGVLVDLAAGLAFLVLWATLVGLLKPLAEALPDLALVLKLVSAPALAGGLSLVALNMVSPYLLAAGIWANPIYVIVGLVAHAYLEIGKSNHTHARADYSFGLLPLARQLGDDRARARPRHAALADALVVALCWWTVILGACWFLLTDYVRGGPAHLGFWVPIALTVIVFGAFFANPLSGGPHAIVATVQGAARRCRSMGIARRHFGLARLRRHRWRTMPADLRRVGAVRRVRR